MLAQGIAETASLGRRPEQRNEADLVRLGEPPPVDGRRLGEGAAESRQRLELLLPVDEKRCVNVFRWGSGRHGERLLIH